MTVALPAMSALWGTDEGRAAAAAVTAGPLSHQPWSEATSRRSSKPEAHPHAGHFSLLARRDRRHGLARTRRGAAFCKDTSNDTGDQR